MSIRPVKRLAKSKPTLEGAGVHLRRAFGFGKTSDFDPFLLLDDFRNDIPEDYLAGFPWHPHRGIETITYVLAGEVEHGDSMGNRGSIGAGDVQWMTAGSGIIHQEMPKAGPLEGLSDEQIVRMVETNMMGAVRTTKAFIPYFREKRAGLFINTSSIGGLITVPFNSLYHAAKWALEGWSESMAFELSQFGIGLKILEPGGMKTDFFTRSFDTGRHQAYDKLVDQVMSVITDPKQMETYSSPEQIAEVVYEAATDGKDQLRYVAGKDAKATYAMRLQVGDEAFRMAMNQQFFGA